MRRLLLIASLAIGLPAAAAAHPAPFSFVDVRLKPRSASLTVVMHIFDAAHDVGVAPSEQLLDPSVVKAQHERLWALVTSRLSVDGRGARLSCVPQGDPEILRDRQALSFRLACEASGALGGIRIDAAMFPYDPVHQTFVNVYDDDRLSAQTILDRTHRDFEYFSRSGQGVLAVVQRFVVTGIQHILIGPDHLLFLFGLLLLGGTVKRLAMVVTAFTVAHSVTLALAALNVVAPSPRIIEPAIALSIVYVGADNLLVKEGRDVRVWIAFAFGLVHGFGFASVLREMDLPRQALGWSLFSFNVGVEIGQVAVVLLVGGALAVLRSRSAVAGLRIARVGSVGVIAAGAFWFVQRVFFPGGPS